MPLKLITILVLILLGCNQKSGSGDVEVGGETITVTNEGPQQKDYENSEAPSEESLTSANADAINIDPLHLESLEWASLRDYEIDQRCKGISDFVSVFFRELETGITAEDVQCSQSFSPEKYILSLVVELNEERYSYISEIEASLDGFKLTSADPLTLAQNIRADLSVFAETLRLFLVTEPSRDVVCNGQSQEVIAEKIVNYINKNQTIPGVQLIPGENSQSGLTNVIDRELLGDSRERFMFPAEHLQPENTHATEYRILSVDIWLQKVIRKGKKNFSRPLTFNFNEIICQ